MSDELKPCPFCGGEAGWVSGSIHCSSCGVSMRGTFGPAAETNKRWNARVERTCRMNHVLLYDEEGVEGIECDECGWEDIHSWDEPMPERCPGCKAKVVAE